MASGGIASVVMVTWAPSEYRMKLLKATVDSLRANTDGPYTWVVVDNGPQMQTDYLKSAGPDIHLIQYINLGVGASRNLGAEATDSRFIAFIDNDIRLSKGWLTRCMDLLNRYDNRKLIVTPMRSSPMKYRKNLVGPLDENTLFRRASGCCLVMRRRDFQEIGPWTTRNLVGGDYSERAVSKGYSFLWYPEGTARHMGRIASYHYRDHLVDGVWTQQIEQQKTYWNRLWARASQQNIRKHASLYATLKPLLVGNVVDLGCGVTSLFDGFQGSVTGIDLSEKSIETMQRRVPKGTWIVGSITFTGLPDKSFDTTLLIGVIEHFSDYSKVLLEAKRITKPGGTVVVVVPLKNFEKDHRHPMWSKKTIDDTVTPFLGPCECELVCKRWWLIKAKQGE